MFRVTVDRKEIPVGSLKELKRLFHRGKVLGNSHAEEISTGKKATVDDFLEDRRKSGIGEDERAGGGGVNPVAELESKLAYITARPTDEYSEEEAEALASYMKQLKKQDREGKVDWDQVILFRKHFRKIKMSLLREKVKKEANEEASGVDVRERMAAESAARGFFDEPVKPPQRSRATPRPRPPQIQQAPQLAGQPRSAFRIPTAVPADATQNDRFKKLASNLFWLIIFALFVFYKLMGGQCSEVEAGDPLGKDLEMKTAREKMVALQIAGRDVSDKRVIEAMKKVPRHDFVPEGVKSQAYDDRPLPIGDDQTISQPYIVGKMSELMLLSGKERVLEIGTGSGYQAAVLAELAKEVYTIEIVDSLCKRAEKELVSQGYKNVHVRCGDGYRGWPEAAPFDAIMITAAPDHIPKPLVEQLKPGGRMVLPVGDFFQELVVVKKTKDGKIERQTIFGVRFVPMTGEAERKK